MKKFLLISLLLINYPCFSMDEQEQQTRIQEINTLLMQMVPVALEKSKQETIEKKNRGQEVVHKINSFLSEGGNLSADDAKIIMVKALATQSVPIMQALVEKGQILPNVILPNGNTPLIAAAMIGSEPLVRYLTTLQKAVAKGANVNIETFRPYLRDVQIAHAVEAGLKERDRQ